MAVAQRILGAALVHNELEHGKGQRVFRVGVVHPVQHDRNGIVGQRPYLIGSQNQVGVALLADFDLVLDETIDDSLDTKLTQYFYSQDTSITDEGITVEQMVNKNVRTLNNPQIKYFIRYDPAPALKKVTCPVLALNGERDLQVDADQNINAIRSALEEGGNRKVTTKVFPRLNHLFQECKSFLLYFLVG